MLTVRGISRSFGDHRVLDEVSFDVRPGRMTGFLGANGSGKTTTMRIVLGVLAAHGGTVSWNGQEVTAQTRPDFGYMPEERGLYPKMKVRDQITWLARLHGVDRETAQRNTDALLEDLELTERAGDRLEELSLGNQQRVQIAAALVHEPAVLILDEPFSGLDPIAVETVLDVLRKRAASGVPVLFSSHQLAIVERLCDDVVIISKGRVVANGSREELRARHAGSRYEIVVAEDAGWVRDVPGASILELDGPRAVFEAEPQQVLRAALERGEVRSFTPVVPTLDEIFREVI
ncbi:ABC-2 type transport system ATP-binding protein [Lentzea albidocapillata subsp. violacea]|uniref:ABC-2 type transport system ATP-binding protein n=1 Tax=Lentzea albidocapillata subsp. violacea TaxID=128104 RepID=A0A1G8PF25_9PSEU|nr:ATP-binding cassette domain-containing protein [Lentzea albidocapillata]SDI91161.1 ABC-2 type transport system ATP-binding protein [Lentzea albidocapillata subsp. violacea]